MTTLRATVALSCMTLLTAVSLGSAGCSRFATSPGNVPRPPPSAALPRPDAGEFSVMTFNLNHYRLEAPPTASDSLQPVPRPEADALVETIRHAAPDILAVQGMGPPAAWAEFQYRLRAVGLEYRYDDYLPCEDQDIQLGVLSRFPIVARQPHTDDRYTIGPSQFPVLRGFIDITLEPNPDYQIRLLSAHLKSKRFHEYGQAEMRRNEARLLGNHIRAALDEHPNINLLVLGTFNDDPGSRVLRDILTYQDKPVLFDLRPVDEAGDAWTYRTDTDTHLRQDYVLVNRGLLNEVVLAKTGILRSAALLTATDHRPLIATFVAREQAQDQAPDLSARTPPVFPEYD
ncbi:MAG: endonuclease/exonuclease/phosphatase family protein [Kiritimatiellae bacterium]|nr:endonuclease/exonuclease/phosphatase family protein [Kiritimatiellia bacterium]